MFPRNRHAYASYDYQYIVSKDDNTHERMMYYYKYEGWTDCSVTCGTGNSQQSSSNKIYVFSLFFSFHLNLYHVYLSISLGEQNLIYGCYSKEDDTKVEQDRCQLLKDPRGKPYKCERSPCSAEQYVNPASLV